MDANSSSPNSDSARPVLIEKELSAEIIAGFYEVYNALGFGFLESIYSKALEIALRRRGLLWGAKSRVRSTSWATELEFIELT
jgi:hypothetical protein